jgi:tetratricopeptide (TPR) repeat protein
MACFGLRRSWPVLALLWLVACGSPDVSEPPPDEGARESAPVSAGPDETKPVTPAEGAGGPTPPLSGQVPGAAPAGAPSAPTPSQKAQIGRTAGGWHATAGSVGRALKLPPDIDPVMAGLLYLRQGDHAKAIASLERATRETPGDAIVWFYLGRANEADTKLGEAEAAYLQALRLDPRLAEARLHLSGIYVEQGRLPEALEALRAIGLTRGRGPMLAYQEGFVLSKMGRFEEAEAMLRQSLQIEPRNTHAWYIRGVNAQRAGYPEVAVQAFQQVIALDPDYADAWFNLGNALARQGRVEEAQQALGRFAEVNEERERAEARYSNLVVLQRGAEMDLADGLLEEVGKQVAEAERVEPGQPWTYRLRAEVLLAQNRPEEARAKLDEAAALNPTDPEEHLALADAYRRIGDLEAAGRHEELARRWLSAPGGGPP